jgi:hypothetical protein
MYNFVREAAEVETEAETGTAAGVTVEPAAEAVRRGRESAAETGAAAAESAAEAVCQGREVAVGGAGSITFSGKVRLYSFISGRFGYK